MIDRQSSAEPDKAEQGATDPAQTTHYDDMSGFDDGLVHNHGWACSERGAPTY